MKLRFFLIAGRISLCSSFITTDELQNHLVLLKPEARDVPIPWLGMLQVQAVEINLLFLSCVAEDKLPVYSAKYGNISNNS